MALYNYKCLHCHSEFELSRKIIERDSVETQSCLHCLKVGNIIRTLSSPLIGYSISVNGGYGSKVPSGFKEVLNKIHKKAPGSNMDKISTFI